MIQGATPASAWILLSCCCSYILGNIAPVQAMTILQGDTAVVGVGVLGTHLCRMILDASSPTSVVLGVTKTSRNHESIRKKLGMNNRLQLCSEESTGSDPNKKYQNVVFCAPPSGFDDYPQAVQDAIDRYWAGPDTGVFVFTSSGAVYGPSGDSNQVGVVTETSKVADASDSPRIARLVNAERASLDAGGCCVRLAGLYDLQRGAHNYWLTKGQVQSSPDGIINLLHYEDAAACCLAALRAGSKECRSRAFLISDGHPMSRYAICEAALKAKVYQGNHMPTFDATDQPWVVGKVYDGTDSNRRLDWKPKYESFGAFMEANA